MKKGCKIPNPGMLSEQYEIKEFSMVANVHVDKIEKVLKQFINRQISPLFFILELPTNVNVEKILRKNDSDPMHKDIYYIDGLSQVEALVLLSRHGTLLINDGLCSFGYGSHDNTAEIMVKKYNVITLWSNTLDKYQGFFEELDIKRTEKLVTAWDTFSDASLGESYRYEYQGKNVYDLPVELKKWGMYFEKQSEE